MRHLTGAFALLLLCVSSSVPPVAAERSRPPSMQFILQSGAPAAACTENCQAWVSASGMIRPETPADFEAFALKHNLRGLTIALESEGGSVLGAMALGRSIRRLGMVTTVGKAGDLASANGRPARTVLSPRADCESMCAFVLLAGVQRFVPDEARVRVHQIWLGDRREDATAAVYSAEDLVLVQRDIGKLTQYTFEMGGSPELLEVSLRIPPWEPMRALSRDELRRMRLDTAGIAAPPPLSGAAPSTGMPPARKISQPVERGWSLVERSGGYALARQHPLTIEGEEIGSFDVLIACGGTPQSFDLFYSELRRGFDGNAAESLRRVEIRIGSRATALNIGETGPVAAGGLRGSSASGSVPAAWLKALADGKSRSMTVVTSLGEQGTVIRVGNTGIAANFPQLAAACAGNAETTHAELIGPR